ncbi:MAG: hypothetical protein IT357_11210, partial [Gemmatimonadaceae bacterium]|nr:hypothetical protein [Gemmatimonadaceae bacterium]
AALGHTDRARQLLNQDATRLDLRIGTGDFGEQPPSSHHIYFWSIGAHRAPLDTAAQFGHLKTRDAMLAFATPLQRFRHACRRADADHAKAIVRAEPGILGTIGPDDHRMLSDAAWDGDAAAVRLMLGLGFDPATPGHDAGNALHCASWQGAADVVAALLESAAGRALINAREPHHGSTPLGWCCHGSLHGPRDKDFAQVAALLIAHGATVEPFEASEEVEDILSAR